MSFWFFNHETIFSTILSTFSVCQLWKTATSDHWAKIDKIDYSRYCYKKVNFVNDDDRRKVKIISRKDAERIVKCAAPFVKALTTREHVLEAEQEVLFGRFLYKVIGFDSNAILLLLAQYAKDIAEIEIFDMPLSSTPHTELSQLLNANSVKKINFGNCNGFYHDIRRIPTDGIEELQICFSDMAIPTLEGVSIIKILCLWH